jgi:hypothetical protein
MAPKNFAATQAACQGVVKVRVPVAFQQPGAVGQRQLTPEGSEQLLAKAENSSTH